MKLREVFDQLATHELNNISIVNQETKQIDTDMYGRAIRSINSGLTEIHTRHLLRRGTLKLRLIEGKDTYVLDRRYNMTGDPVEDQGKYILPGTRFNNDLISIIGVKTADGRELTINNRTDWFNVQIANGNTITVPTEQLMDCKADTLMVEYKQNHKMIPSDVHAVDPDCYSLDLPQSYLWALCLFVAARLHVPIGLQDGTYTGNSFMSLFAQELAVLENVGTNISDVGLNTGVWNKGFP